MELPPLRPTSIVPAQRVGPGAQERQAGGRVFSAEVVQTSAGGSLVLAVGPNRIAATSLAALAVGQKLWLRLRGSGAAQTLEILSPPGEVDSLPQPVPSVAHRPHPFGLLAQGKGLGELLTGLEQALAAGGKASSSPATHQALEAFAFAPGDSGAQLAAHLSRSGLGHEASALGAALQHLPAAALLAAAEELVAHAFRVIEPAAAALSARNALGQELARSLGDPGALARLASFPPEPGGSVQRAVAVLSAWIAPALSRHLGASTQAEQRAQIAERLAVARLSPRLAQAVLEVLLGDQAALARELQGPSAPEASQVKSAPIDLKAWLTALADSAQAPPERAAARAALDALEAEQFVALARSSLGEGTHVPFAVREAAGFADAHLVHRRAPEREAHEAGDRDGGAERAVLGLEFSRTGPVRAEFVLNPTLLRVRLSVASDEVAAQLNAQLAQLQAQLEALGRGVRLDVAVCPRESLRVPGPEVDALLGDGGPAVDVRG